MTGGPDAAAIGGYYDSGDKSCGNIVIKNVTLHAYAIGNYMMAIAPGIGATGGTCGRIEISSAIVYARSFYCYSGTGNTVDKTMVYDASGNAMEQ